MAQAVESKPKFQIQLIPAYTTFIEGESPKVPFLIDGVLPRAGYSSLCSKPKQGKSSLSRCEAVAVSKGSEFLGRSCAQGAVVLVSLEDPRYHVDNCLQAMGYDPKSDAPIYIVDQLPHKFSEALECLEETLSKKKDVRFVVIDTLAKCIRFDKIDGYMETLTPSEQLRQMALRVGIHIQGLVHSKKVQTDDPFDSLLGSTGLRGEPDTTLVLYRRDGQRIIESETRIGKRIPASILQAEVIDVSGCDVISAYSLAGDFERWKEETETKRETNKTRQYEERVIAFLSDNNWNVEYNALLNGVKGKTSQLVQTIKKMINAGLLVPEGEKSSKSNPYRVRLVKENLGAYRFIGTCLEVQ